MKHHITVALISLVLALFTPLSQVDAVGNRTSLGVCYYPEQWPRDMWASDAAQMKALGLEYVRIGEFMWSTIEPSNGLYDWTLLDDAITTLTSAGLRVILGTPTATPPKWLVDAHPSILPVDRFGRSRTFGSRRHYAFSSRIYRNETQRIVTQMATRYGGHDGVAGWQLDNEYGCHDTVHSYDADALVAFRIWLKTQYATITDLNVAWGNVFWSMMYNTFDEVDFPVGTVTEANPSHWLDYYRFASDAVIEYNKLQVDILRALSPGKFLTTNLMGWFFDFDAFKLGDDLDFVTWDSYPLGFTDTSLGIGELFTPQQKITYARSGHVDLAAFHHDLYRAVGRGSFGIMEQQPGPVNWAGNNPSPAPGMVRLWSWEAFAHGADLVSYFRWRQAPFAQEQMHAGLKRRDNIADIAYSEVKQLHAEQELVAKLLQQDGAVHNARVAIAFDYEAVWYHQIQPQGSEWSYIKLVYMFYSSARQLGVDIDFVALNHAGVNISQYDVLMIPSLPYMSVAAVTLLSSYKGSIIMGPRSGSKTLSFQIPSHMPPSINGFHHLLPIVVQRVESLRAGVVEDMTYIEPGTTAKNVYSVGIWKELVSVNKSRTGDRRVTMVGTFKDDNGAIFVSLSQSNIGPAVHYLAFWPTHQFLRKYLSHRFDDANIPYHTDLGDFVRISRRGHALFITNYGNDTSDIPVMPSGAHTSIGSTSTMAAYDISIWWCNESSCWQPDDSASRGSILLLIVLLISGFVFLACSVWLYNRVKTKRKSHNSGALSATTSINSPHTVHRRVAAVAGNAASGNGSSAVSGLFTAASADNNGMTITSGRENDDNGVATDDTAAPNRAHSVPRAIAHSSGSGSHSRHNTGSSGNKKKGRDETTRLLLPNNDSDSTTAAVHAPSD